EGFHRVQVNGETRELEHLKPSEAVDATGTAHVVVDRLVTNEASLARLTQAVEQAWGLSDGEAHAHGSFGLQRMRRGLVCPKCARSFEQPSPGLFSYQSPV